MRGTIKGMVASIDWRWSRSVTYASYRMRCRNDEKPVFHYKTDASDIGLGSERFLFVAMKECHGTVCGMERRAKISPAGKRAAQ